jgi:glycosyltransferase involved in cell wall biosynthesis
MAPDSIQVIIPAHDDEATIAAVVLALRAQGLGRIRVVDSGSTDGTAAAAGLAGAAVLKEPEPGYGRACARGYRELGGDVRWVLFGDALGGDELKELPRLLEAGKAGADLVLLGGREAGWGQRLAMALIRWGWGHRFYNPGPWRLVRREVLEKMNLADLEDGWAAEMQVRAVELRATIVEITLVGAGSKTLSGRAGSWRRQGGVLAVLAKLWWRKTRR